MREQALEGAFDTIMCKGIDECQFIPEELIELVKEAIKKFEKDGNTESFKDIVKKMRR